MQHSSQFSRIWASCLAAILVICFSAPSLVAQDAPVYSPEQLDRLISRIALYPDPLLAQILTASTYPDQIPDAAAWADEHHDLTGEQLSTAIEDDHLSWDPGVLALLPFPSVLDMMASDSAWANDLGNAVLAQRPDVMDAVQRMRGRAWDYGYLRSNEHIVVRNGPFNRHRAAEPGIQRRACLRPAHRFRPAPTGLFRWRCDRLRFWRQHRRVVSSLGMGRRPHRMGSSRSHHQQQSLGPHLG